MITDIFLYETGSGGDILLRNNDLVLTEGYENMPFIAMFGGNGSWMDDLLLEGDQKHTAQTEGMLDKTTLNSAGRQAIEQAIESDLSFLEDDISGTKVSVSVAIASRNRANATINAAGQVIYMNWNPDSSFLTYALK